MKPIENTNEEIDILVDENSISENTLYDRAGVNVSTGVACLYHWLKNRKLKDFNWKTSMHNKARQDMIENNQTDIESAFLEMVNNPPHQVMTLGEITDYLTKQKEDPENFWGGLSGKEKQQIKKLAQKHLNKQERIKISREPDPDGDGWVTLEKKYEVHYLSLDRKRTFSTKELRVMHDARKKW